MKIRAIEFFGNRYLIIAGSLNLLSQTGVPRETGLDLGAQIADTGL